ncbi:uncharacterized protein LOC115885648 isoform X2 [Sitophilus oryzae]|uniref:Uncharacterized protein LOC115885648 isoform X2 n=1 Tax=Sitophilus oryzae TaxID=7048 RepID=A0A6J2YB60_SITOR|nr:uncharacterized protein LOC115885648 isoform X2 [Sitophilus oryzae]
MVRFSIVAQILIVVFVLLDISLARPPIIFMDEPRNKTRILTNPPREAIVDNTNIVFPEDLTKSKPKTGSISRDDIMSNCTEQMPLCEYAVSYPHEHLKIVLTRNTIYKELFGEDESPEVSNRIGEVDDDIYMCRATSTTIFPKQGLNRNNQWKYIINQDDRDFRQGVRIEQCKNFGLGCDIPGQNPLNLFGYRDCYQSAETECRSRIPSGYHPLVAAPTKKTLEEVPFVISPPQREADESWILLKAHYFFNQTTMRASRKLR